MNDESEFDPTGILPLLDAEAGVQDPSRDFGAEAEMLRRLEVEALGLLAYDLEPVTPRPGARERLLGALPGGQEDLAPVVSLAAARAERAAPAPAASTEPRRRWAAAVILGLLGLGAAGWLLVERNRLADEIARISREHATLVAALREREVQLSNERETRLGEVGRRDEALAVVSTRGVEVCPLRPVGAASTLQPNSFAVLYMAPSQKSWYVKASQLAPPPPGQTYRVWFETATGSVLVGELRPAPDLDLKFAAAGFRTLPMTGVKVTLEPTSSASQPSGPMVLFGSDKMLVL